MNTNLDIQGHRGCRGLMPENTIPGFLHALDLGVNTLEMDVVVSKDHKVVVSHEPFFNHEISTDPNGQTIQKKDEKTHNMYQLDLDGILTYDVGKANHPRFPDQKKISVTKAPFQEMVKTVEEHVSVKGYKKPFYNIEIKRVKAHDNVYHPEYKLFTDLVIKEIEEAGIMDRTTVQCFDLEVLQYMHIEHPHVKDVFLVQNIKGIKKNIENLGHTPYIYSPYYKLVNKRTVKYCDKNNVQLIPWTVNEIADMQKMMDYGVHGIITDFPDRLIALTKI